MAVFNWSALSSGDLVFNPNSDVLHFDNASINAADLTATSSSGVSDNIFSYQGKTVRMLTSSHTLGTSNVTFANGMTRTVWLLCEGCTAFPILCPMPGAIGLHSAGGAASYDLIDLSSPG